VVSVCASIVVFDNHNHNMGSDGLVRGAMYLSECCRCFFDVLGPVPSMPSRHGVLECTQVSFANALDTLEVRASMFVPTVVKRGIELKLPSMLVWRVKCLFLSLRSIYITQKGKKIKCTMCGGGV
jgi:hypothetical protein